MDHRSIYMKKKFSMKVLLILEKKEDNIAYVKFIDNEVSAIY